MKAKKNTIALAAVCLLMAWMFLVPSGTTGSQIARAQGIAETPTVQPLEPLTRSLSGTLGVVWYDGETPENTSPRIYLFDENGGSYLLQIPEDTREGMGGLFALNNRRVKVSGVLEVQAQAGEDVPAVFNVSSVDLQSVTAAEEEVSAAAATGSKPWVNILCKFNGDPTEPEPVSYFQGLMGTGFGGLNHYWQTASYGKLNINGSTVVAHWYTLPYSRSAYISGGANLQKLAKDCTAVANGDVHYPSYFGINLMFNDDLDGYAWGGGWYLTLDGTSKVYPLTWMPPWGYQNQSSMAHEMGHAYGLPHSSGPYGQTYDSEWDVMSDTWPCLNTSVSDYGCIGTDTISYHKSLLGWIPTARRYVSVSGTSRLIAIERLGEMPANPDSFLMAKVSIPGSSFYYTIEVRDNITNNVFSGGVASNLDEYEDSVPSNNINRVPTVNQPVVVIHGVNPNRDNEAQVVDQTSDNNPNDEGAMWRVGEVFIDSARNIRIEVVQAYGNGFLVRIRNGNAPNNSMSSPVVINTLPFSFDEDTTTTDTSENDPAIPCGGGIQGEGTVWYQYKPTSHGIVSVDTTTSNFDTLLAVWTGAAGSLTNIACDDDSGGSGTSSLTFNATSGTTYYIEVAGKTGKGDLSFHLDMTPCYTATTKVSPSGAGIATVDTAPNCMGDKYLTGTSITYSAVPNGGYIFKSWSGNATGVDNPITVPITSNQTVTANFVTTATTPTLLSPANNALSTDYTPLFTWSGAVMYTGTTFDHYQFQLAVDSGFTALVYDQNITDIGAPQFAPPADLQPNLTHYWRVRVFNTLGNYSLWSAVRTVRTALPPPVPASPTEAFHSLVLRPVFDWDDVTDAAGYTIQISKNSTFTSLAHSANPTASTYTPTVDLPKNTTLYWRVRTRGANGPSDWSVIRSLTTPNPPPAPALSLPASNALITDYTPAFTWKAVAMPSGTVFQKYIIQVDDHSDFSNPEIDDETSISPAFTPGSALTPNTKYYWHVRAVNTAGEMGNWSATWYFRAAILPPVLDGPLNGSGLLHRRPAFEWQDVTGATGYKIVVSRSPGFGSSVLNTTSKVSSFTPGSDLPAGTLLYWRVQATGPNGPSLWSETRTLTTGNPPGIPSLSLPASNALDKSYRPLFKWSVVTVPLGTAFDHYQLQVDDDPAFGSPAVDVSVNSLGTPQFQPLSDLNSNTKYYWRVRSFNTLGQYSAWSGVRYFRAAMLKPVLNSPVDGSALLVRRPDLDWLDTAGATGYKIVISRYPNFSSPIVNTTAKVSFFIPTSDLPASTLLYWRVQATGPNGPSDWSNPLTFITGNSPGVPALVSPASNALQTDYTPLFTWKVVTVPAGKTFDRYQIQVDDDSAFGSLAVDENIYSLTATQFEPLSNLNSNTKYYWRVRAFTTDGHMSAWSSVRYFRSSMLKPTLLTPSDGSLAGSLKPVFDWADVTGATNYTIQVSTSSSFGTLLVNSTTVSSTYTPLKNLPAGRVIYWRVRANGANGPTDWVKFQFTTP